MSSDRPDDDAAAREALVRVGASLFDRGLTHGRTGNLSVRLGDEALVTPTAVSLGELTPDRLARVSLNGRHLSGPAPSKEAFLHLAMYRARPQDMAVVHLHSTHAVAVACRADVHEDDVLPPLTPYYVMRVGRLPLLPYHAPGDRALEPIAEEAARDSHALLIANHGPIVAAADLGAAVDAMEELEETARLVLLLDGKPTRPLSAEQVARLRRA
jgi:ribulose-5-phosphate 4-epimerase/fuculose-1-phosphate aldolase